MGYDLSIGEAEITWSEYGAEVSVSVVKLDSAPAFGEPTDFQNQRWPSYSTWSNVCEALDIKQVMFDEKNGGSDFFKYKDQEIIPLIRSHAGHTPITKYHLEYIEEKVDDYKRRNPSHIAKYPPLKEGLKEDNLLMNKKEDYVDDPKYDPNLCRAEWLIFWMNWALGNCEHPIFVNF